MLYGLFARPDDVLHLIGFLTTALPPAGQDLVQEPLKKLSMTPPSLLSLHGFIAFVFSFFAAVRALQALIIGLNRICRRGDVRKAVHFNIFTFTATLIAFIGAFLASNIALAVPVLLKSLSLDFRLTNFLLTHEQAFLTGSFVLALTFLYHYAVDTKRLPWRASFVGAISAALVEAVISQIFIAFFSVSGFGLVYGSLAAVTGFLLWTYWSAYAMFLGGAIATEFERIFLLKSLKADLSC